ncbi:MAG: class I SAM-dependent DNA methyltransferase [Nitrospirota bacterium]
MVKKKKADNRKSNGGNLGFEEKLWQAADKMRGHMDPAEYKHVVLGLIFLKYISDAFEERRSQLETLVSEPSSEYYVKEKQARYGIVEDRDEYLSENIFWVSKKARWPYLQANAKQPTIGKLIDDSMVAIEKENPSLKGVLPKDYARPTLDKHILGELIDLVGTIGLGSSENRSKDILGRVYEYFLGHFASAEGKGGGQFYTPQSVVKLLVGMIEPYKGRVYDPCCGSGGMFVQSEKFVEAHGGKRGDISIYGQESNPTTWRLCRMNLAIRGIEGNIGSYNADTLMNDLHKDLKADFILANPEFNQKEWKGELLREDVRWKHGVPPLGNANFAWVQHMIHHLSPNGIAGFVLANGSMSSNTSGEGEIRKNIIEADLVDCMIALPGQLFYTTPIPACLWFISRSKKNGKFRDRRGKTLFIDARKMGHLIDRTHRELSDEEISKIADTYHSWKKSDRSDKSNLSDYHDIPGFCKSVAVDVDCQDF